MFLFQKLNYNHIKVTSENKEILSTVYDNLTIKPTICGFDTETTGLHHELGKPFLVTFGYDKTVFSFEPSEELILELFKVMNKFDRVFAHNAKYDYHMLWNFLGREPIEIEDKIADSMSVARLTNYADEEMSISLEALGTKYVDDSAKFAGKVIKKKIIELNKEHKKLAKTLFLAKYPKVSFKEAWEGYHKRVAYIDDDNEYFKFLDSCYAPANYYDVYKLDPDLMTCYAIDDIVIMLEYLEKALPVLCKVDYHLNTFNRECKLISAIARMEKTGIKIDINYMLESRKRLIAYKEELYSKLYKLADCELTVGQHELIRKVMLEKYNVSLMSCDKKSLKSVPKTSEGYEMAQIIITLRTVDKWLSTYIDGKLNDIVNGRIYTDINNSGAVSGRVSCDMQQQPKEPLLDQDGKELFHPRRAFIPDDDYIFVFEDMSQMELRVQAYYTLKVGKGDRNLCRAYIPLDCVSVITGEEFDIHNQNDIDNWDSGEWVLKENQEQFWQPTDLHTLTTFTAFPFLNHDKNHPEFKHYRKLGKMCNFLKNYQGGIGAIMEQLDIPQDIAQQLDSAYYKAFPQIKDYQTWVNNQLTTYGYVKNLYGRSYYMKNSKYFYKAGNYVIQGSCADLIKSAEIRIDELLKGKKSKFILPIHDEVMVLLHKDEEYLIKEVQKIMQDTRDVMPYIPMISDIEIAKNNWADKEDYDT